MADEPAPAEADAEPDALTLRALVEALLFVSDGPVTSGALSRALDVTPHRIELTLDDLDGLLGEHGVQLQRGPEGAQLITAPEAAAAVERFLGLESARRLSTAALETLAVVAYRQPVTRAAIEAIRGTSSDAVLATLRARALIERVGRAAGPGRPALYGTTQRFLEHFGLRRAAELPGLDEFAARLGVPPPSEQPSLLDRPEPVADGAGPHGARQLARAQSAGPASAAPSLPRDAGAAPGRRDALPRSGSTVPRQPSLGL